MRNRRAFLAASLALTACKREAKGVPITPVAAATPLKPLKAAPFPIGCAMMSGKLKEPIFAELLVSQVSQLTPEWEMKMEYILQNDGSMRFDAPDAIAAFARARGLRLFGHNLIWYAFESEAFKKLSDADFARNYRNYILAVVGRYKGQAVGWDVVNEPVNEDGSGLRDCLWTRRLGTYDHIVRAYDHAAEADPTAVLFINDYFLERLPAKRAQFMRMVETLLKKGCKLGGLGTQTHVDIDLPKGAITVAMKELATFGLPIHLSELDVSVHPEKIELRPRADRLQVQARVAGEAADAFMALPAKQRFAFSVWGLRDVDSWLRGPNGASADDEPALFDAAGAAKPSLRAVEKAFGL